MFVRTQSERILCLVRRIGLATGIVLRGATQTNNSGRRVVPLELLYTDDRQNKRNDGKNHPGHGSLLLLLRLGYELRLALTCIHLHPDHINSL